MYLRVSRKVGTNYNPYIDSSIFLIRHPGVNIFLQPLNPLRYTYDTATSFIPDQIDKSADEVLSTIVTSLGSLTSASATIAAHTAKSKGYGDDGEVCGVIVWSFEPSYEKILRNAINLCQAIS